MSTPLLISRDAELIEIVLAAAAAVQATATQARDTETIRHHWASASPVLVGADQAGVVAGLSLPRRPGVHLCGADADELLAWSVPLAAPVLVVPRQSGYLSSLLVGQDGLGQEGAQVLRLVSGSGGVGATTAAAVLAQRAATQGMRVTLVETDPAGGGIDLLFGAEQEPGWRWPDLASASGHVGDLAGRFPHVSGVDLVAVGRPRRDGPLAAPAGLPRPEAVQAVLASLVRGRDLVVLDAGSAPSALGANRAITLVCVAAEVKAVVSARARVAEYGLTDAQVIVRTGPGRRLDAGLVGETLGLPVCGTIPHDRRLPIALESGEPPGRGRRRLTRACDAVLKRVLGNE